MSTVAVVDVTLPPRGLFRGRLDTDRTARKLEVLMWSSLLHPRSEPGAAETKLSDGCLRRFVDTGKLIPAVAPSSPARADKLSGGGVLLRPAENKLLR